MLGGASGPGLIPEQVWELPDLAASPFGTDPTVASIGFRNGGPAGSASPLTWSDGQYVRLMRDLATGKVLEQPAAVVNRYVTHHQGQTTLTPPYRLAFRGHGWRRRRSGRGATPITRVKPQYTSLIPSNRRPHPLRGSEVEGSSPGSVLGGLRSAAKCQAGSKSVS